MAIRSLFVTLILSTFVFGCSSKSKSGGGVDYQTGELSGGYEYFSANDNIFVSEQPNEEQVNEFKTELDVGVVINLRGKSENRKVQFNPKTVAKSAGMKFYQIPLMKKGQPSEKALSKITKVMDKYSNEKVMVYCSSGNRAAAWYGIYKAAASGGLSTAQAIEHAESMGLKNRKLKGVTMAYLTKSGLTQDVVESASEAAEEMSDDAKEGMENLSEEADEATDGVEETMDEATEELEELEDL